jgi:hypothetical protein
MTDYEKESSQLILGGFGLCFVVIGFVLLILAAVSFNSSRQTVAEELSSEALVLFVLGAILVLTAKILSSRRMNGGDNDESGSPNHPERNKIQHQRPE